MTDEEIKFLKENIKGKTTDELIILMHRHFGKTYKRQQIKYYKRKYGLVSGVDTKFKKGRTPHNKQDIGYSFVDTKKGYTYVKTKKGWKLKHRFIYEQSHGDIPKGYSVVFADQNIHNFEPDNLLLVEDRDKLVAKNKKLFSSDKELTKTGLLIAKLSNKCYDKSKK